MKKALFITGTGTDVGKTYVTGLLLKRLVELGKCSAYFKAAMSGNDRDEHGVLLPGDAVMVKKLSGIVQPLSEMCPYIYETAVSPHLASRLEGNPVRMGVVKTEYQKLLEKYDYIVTEGSGGIICPIGYDEERIQMEDVVKELGLSSLIVADAGLGTINAVVLTVEYMKAKNMAVRGIILNHFHPADVMEEDNLRMCERMTGVPVIACVKEGDNEIQITEEEIERIFEVNKA